MTDINLSLYGSSIRAVYPERYTSSGAFSLSNVIFASGLHQPFNIDSNDRRFFIILTENKRLTDQQARSEWEPDNYGRQQGWPARSKAIANATKPREKKPAASLLLALVNRVKP